MQRGVSLKWNEQDISGVHGKPTIFVVSNLQCVTVRMLSLEQHLLNVIVPK